LNFLGVFSLNFKVDNWIGHEGLLSVLIL